LIQKETTIALLRNENEEYRKLEVEHLELEKVLKGINKRKHLTPEEDLERKKVQKQKLLVKDRMAEIVRNCSDQPVDTVIYRN